MTTKPCPPLEDRITKSLLGYGVIAGPVYLIVVALQAVTREGFDPARHDASLLSNGSLGWIQIANFVVTGVMTIAAGVGVRRALGTGAAATWSGWLVVGYGVGIVAAGLFRADPSLGFPPGTPAGRGSVSWHGMLHLVSASAGFLCLIAACFVVASWFSRDGRRGWAWYSRLTGAAFAAGFAAIASGSSSPVVVVVFSVSVVIAWAWLTAISVKLYRNVAKAAVPQPR
ncbi:DUF998 domain-containing protein [uncultured Mycobacterium sp.]|uniref:DUF998 domain-containing protein n=1 Tax=uncultured Mycobacterium sp. TaxID=171292 RepID=UPI0035C9E7D7